MRSVVKIIALNFLTVAALSFLLCQNASASTITGIVYDNHNNTLSDVDVELMGNIGSFKGRTRTNSVGRYEFAGLGDGYFTVRVLPFRYDFEEQSQQVYIQTVSVTGAGATIEPLDFYLTPKKGSLMEAEAKVIFAQDVPGDAKKFYEKAVDAISKKRIDEGIAGLENAIAKFPKYYQALLDLGKIYYVKGDFSKSTNLFLKAAEINNKSAMSFFFLGDSLRRLGYNKASVIALNQSHTLNPGSIQVLLSLGTVERLEGKYPEAEKHLLLAKKLTKAPIAELHWQLAQLYAGNLKKYDKAADELEAFLKARPDAKDVDKIKKIIKNLQEKSKTQAVN
ncbi:MAG TPA: tetratricopeptide repeat protein [Pyrinomonadaceae bacterium]|jgi:tetratricopeptide (TPR) repeat protein